MAKEKDKPKKGKVVEEDPMAGFNLGEDEPESAAPIVEEPEQEEAEEAATNGPAKGDVGTEITMDGIKRATSGGKMFVFFKNPGDRYEVRFLDDLLKGKKVPRHEDYDKKLKPTTCLRVYKEECPLCEAGVGVQEWFAWNVIDFADLKNSPKVLALKGVGSGGRAISALAAYYREEGSILGVNFVLEQEGSGQKKNVLATAKLRANPEQKAAIRKVIEVLLPKKRDLLKILKPKGTATVEGASTEADFGDLKLEE